MDKSCWIPLMFALLVNIHWVQEGVFWLEDTYRLTAHTIELVSGTGYMSLGILTVTLRSRPLVAPFYKWRNRDGDFSSSRRFQVTNVSRLSPPSISHFLKNSGWWVPRYSMKWAMQSWKRGKVATSHSTSDGSRGLGRYVDRASVAQFWNMMSKDQRNRYAMVLLWYIFVCMRVHAHTHTWITPTHAHMNHTRESHTPFSSLDHTQNTIHTFAVASKSAFSVSLIPDPPTPHTLAFSSLL